MPKRQRRPIPWHSPARESLHRWHCQMLESRPCPLVPALERPLCPTGALSSGSRRVVHGLLRGAWLRHSQRQRQALVALPLPLGRLPPKCLPQRQRRRSQSPAASGA